MTTMTYDSLFRQIEATLARTEKFFIEYIPQFITQAHNRIVSECKSLEMVTYANGNILADINTLTKPALWRRPLALKLILPNNDGSSLYVPVEWRSYEFCRRFWPFEQLAPTSQIIDPLYWGDYGQQNLILSPTPSRDLGFELSFYGVPPIISKYQQTNYLTEFAPNTLLYGTLLEASKFIKDDVRIPVWEQAYQSAVNILNNNDEMGKEDRSAIYNKD